MLTVKRALVFVVLPCRKVEFEKTTGDRSHIGIIYNLELLEEVKNLTNNNIGNETNAIMI